MAFSFKPGDIKRTCGHQAYQRGMNYWKSDKVIDVQLTDESATQQIISRVAGSNGEVYDTQIEVLEYDDGDCEIIGECSCPVQIDCKHIAATLLQTLHSGPQAISSNSDNQLENWLDELKKASQGQPATEEAEQDESPYRLLYVLESNPERQDPYAIEIVTQKVRQLKKGGYGKPSAFPLEKASETFYANDFLKPADRDIAQLITNARNFYYYNYGNNYTLKREMGELALQKMLLTGRCHWGDKDNPSLRLGTPRQIGFEWHNMGNGQQLEVQIAPPISQIFRAENFWYVDLETQEVGALDHPALSGEQVEALLNAPVIPEENLEEVSRELVLKLPEYQLEAPIALDFETIDVTDTEPTAVLKLHKIDLSSGSDHDLQFHCARLEFDYQNVRVTTLPGQVIFQNIDGNKIYRVTRDSPAEKEIIETLHSLGLGIVEPNAQDPRLDWFFASETRTESAQNWDYFLEFEIPALKEKGWKIEVDDSFAMRFEESEEWLGELEEGENEWFSMSLGVELDGERVNLLPLLINILQESNNPQSLRDHLQAQSAFLVEVRDNHWLKIPSERLLPFFDTLVELYDRDPLDDNGNIALTKQQILQLNDLLNNPKLTWRGAEELIALNKKLRDFSGIANVDVSKGFNAELRDYQQQGLNWLQFLREYEFNGILADDMGLGKTIQTLAHLLIEKQSGRMKLPCLIIAPTSLVSNWRRETEKFAPELSVLVLHGKDRHYDFHRIQEHDLVITTYPLIRRDRDVLNKIEFHMIVLDEAQYIKNPKSQTTQTVYELKSKNRLCLSGTPVENHLGEFWSMFHFLMPGYLGNLERFNRIYRNPIEKQEDDIRREQLSKRVAPFLLRRTKDEVASELPKKTEIIRTVSLQGQQRDLYESIRLAMDQKVRAEINKKGLARSHIMILDALLKLRQACCDPRLVSLPQAEQVTQSAKMELLMEMVPEMIEEGRKILIFSQFTKMLALIEDELIERDITYSKLTGQTRKREEAIAQFQEGDASVFLISLKAGGVGLNLTAADTVIHYDPWWNPAAENQATDRAHRIGQDKAVFVYKLITEDTVEDRILAMQERKRALAESIYSGSGSNKGSAISSTDLTELFQPLE